MCSQVHRDVVFTMTGKNLFAGWSYTVTFTVLLNTLLHLCSYKPAFLYVYKRGNA